MILGWSKKKPSRKKKKPTPSDEFRKLKGVKREALIAARKANRLTQAQLGELVGCSSVMISHLENGRMNPSVEISLQLELVLGKPFFELFHDL